MLYVAQATRWYQAHSQHVKVNTPRRQNRRNREKAIARGTHDTTKAHHAHNAIHKARPTSRSALSSIYSDTRQRGSVSHRQSSGVGVGLAGAPPAISNAPHQHAMRDISSLLRLDATPALPPSQNSALSTQYATRSRESVLHMPHHNMPPHPNRMQSRAHASGELAGSRGRCLLRRGTLCPAAAQFTCESDARTTHTRTHTHNTRTLHGWARALPVAFPSPTKQHASRTRAPLSRAWLDTRRSHACTHTQTSRLSHTTLAQASRTGPSHKPLAQACAAHLITP